MSRQKKPWLADQPGLGVIRGERCLLEECLEDQGDDAADNEGIHPFEELDFAFEHGKVRGQVLLRLHQISHGGEV